MYSAMSHQLCVCATNCGRVTNYVYPSCCSAYLHMRRDINYIHTSINMHMSEIRTVNCVCIYIYIYIYKYIHTHIHIYLYISIHTDVAAPYLSCGRKRLKWWDWKKKGENILQLTRPRSVRRSNSPSCVAGTE